MAPFAELDRQVLLGTWRKGGLEEIQPVLDFAYAPRLSGDGQWLAYLKIPSVRRGPELCIRRLADTTERILGPVQVGRRNRPPEDRGEDYVWSQKQPVLYFVSFLGFDGVQLSRVSAETGSAVEALTPVLNRLLDPQPHPDGDRLAYWTSSDSREEIRLLQPGRDGRGLLRVVDLQRRPVPPAGKRQLVQRVGSSDPGSASHSSSSAATEMRAVCKGQTEPGASATGHLPPTVQKGTSSGLKGRRSMMPEIASTRKIFP